MPEDKPLARNEAVALAYSAGDAAPRVVAKGKGVVAREIIERAREAGVYVHESPELVSLLLQVDLDARIPPQLYVAIAELLAWLYRIEQGFEASAAPQPKDLPPSLRGLTGGAAPTDGAPPGAPSA